MDEIGRMCAVAVCLRQHGARWARAGRCAGASPARGREVREAVCASTYVGGLFLRQFQLFLGVFESLGVFVQLIFRALEFLL